LTVPDEAKLAEVIKGVTSKELKPYVDTIAATTLLESAPAPGSIVKNDKERGNRDNRMGT
jgi:hypothetical protein